MSEKEITAAAAALVATLSRRPKIDEKEVENLLKEAALKKNVMPKEKEITAAAAALVAAVRQGPKIGEEHNLRNARLSADDNGWLIRASVRCPKCGVKHTISVNELCTCSCGNQFYADADSCVHDVPFSLEKFSYECRPPWMPSGFLTAEREEARFEEVFSVFRATVGVDVTSSSLDDPLPKELKADLLCEMFRTPHKSIAQSLSQMHRKHAESVKSEKKIRIIFAVIGLLCWGAMAEQPCVLLYIGAVLVALVWLLSEWSSFTLNRRWQEQIEQLRRALPKLLHQESMRLEEDIAAYTEKMHQDRIRQAEEQRQEKERARIRKDDEQLAQCISLGRMPFSEFVRNVRKGDGHAYERRLQIFFDRLHISCEKISDSADQGVDLIVEKSGHRIAIQCKFYKQSVGNSAVQEVFAGREYYSCQEAWVVSNAEFTKSARCLAETIHVSLIEQNELVTQMKKSGIL